MHSRDGRQQGEAAQPAEPLKRLSALSAEGRLREAAALGQQLLAAHGDDPALLYRLGIICAESGDIDRAATLLVRAAECDPKNVEALADLGVLFRRQGRNDEALACYRAALARDPAHPNTLFNCANLHRAAGRMAEAAEHYRRTLAANPDHLGALNNMGLLLHDTGRYDDAVACYRRALEKAPESPELNNNLGNALKALDRNEEAVASYRRAVALKPGYAVAWCNLSVVLQSLWRLDESIEAVRTALGLIPDDVEMTNHLGALLTRTGRYEAAAAVLDNAVALDPAAPEPHWNRANLWLMLGRLREGWAEYEWRLRCPGLNAFGRTFDAPRWNGETLDGRTVLIHGEQGFGDTIQFARYLPMVQARGGKVLFECREELARLFADAAGIDALAVAGQPLPPFDGYAPLLSLPFIFGTDQDSIPADVPYLAAPETGPDLPEPDGRRRVGIVWAGRSDHRNDRNRSVAFERFRALCDIAGVQLCSLQLGPARAAVAADERVIDLADGLSDFAATAAVLERLDLLITVDTAVAHLAGALARPVWLLLPFVPDWRWMLERQDSPWYPTMRLYRQPAADDWDSVFARIDRDLRDWAQAD